MQNLAQDNGGRCLSQSYFGINIDLSWECSEHHQWQQAPRNIVNGKWCKICAQNKRNQKRLSEMKQIAEQRGGKCLTEIYYEGGFFDWQCSQMHTWSALGACVKQGAWCADCGGSKKKTVEDMHKLAAGNNGKFLSLEYFGDDKLHDWQCCELHIFQMRAGGVKSGKWCKVCAINKRKLTKEQKQEKLLELQKIAESRGGKCLSTDFIAMDTKMYWQCSELHIWPAVPDSVKFRNTWCPVCAGKHQTIEDMYELAMKRNGKCLSNKYLGVKTHLQWQCSNGHIWLAIPDSVKNTWCPHCKIGFNELFCKYYLEELFCYKFNSIKPDWLRNQETNRNLQLDGHCAELNLAFEYNGEQHYKKVKFHQNISDDKATNNFTKQQKRDKLKIELCKKNNTKLIIIPYWENKDLPAFINKECEKLGFVINKNVNIDNIIKMIYI